MCSFQPGARIDGRDPGLSADYLVFTMSTCELHAAPCPTEDTALVQASCGRLRLFGSRRPRPQISGGRRRATAPRCRTTALGRTWSTTPTKTFWRSVTSLEWAWRPGCAAGLSCLSPLLSPRAPAANGTEIVAAASVRPRPRQRKRVIRTGCAVHWPAQVDRGRIDLGKLTDTRLHESARGMAAWAPVTAWQLVGSDFVSTTQSDECAWPAPRG